MSRIGKHPVLVPDGVEVELAGQTVTAKGKLGQRSLTLSEEVEVSIEDRHIWVKPRHDTPRGRTMWGTCRSLVNNLIVGVAEGFTINLEISGVGYRAAVAGNKLT
ncbi:MAG: 50S ribosomal protein L6, partial [Kiloniellales bacterium]